MSKGEGNKEGKTGFEKTGPKIPKLTWDVLRHGRMTDPSGRFHPETGAFLDDLPRGVGRPYLEGDDERD